MDPRNNRKAGIEESSRTKPGSREPESCRILSFEILSRFPGLVQGVFSRRGGVSPEPYAGLNLGYGTGDAPDNVTKNLAIARRTAGVDRWFLLEQVHGDDVVVVEEEKDIPQADGAVTGLRGTGLLIRQADCASVILYDPVKNVIGAVHSGWRGSVENIVGKTVDKMRTVFGCLPRDLWAGQGPSLGPCCAEYRDHRTMFPSFWDRYHVGDRRFDFWSLVEDQLSQAGVPLARIESCRICTRCRTGDFYSYRGEGVTGRFGTFIGMTDGNPSP